MTASSTDPDGAVRGLMQSWDSAAWCLAALAVVVDRRSSEAQRGAAGQLLHAAGLPAAAEPEQVLSGSAVEGIGAQARAPLMQIAALVGDPGGNWARQTDESLIAQGQASAQSARMFAQLLLPHLDGLVERFNRPDARMLDVGVGVAAQAIAFATAFAELTVVGIDVLPRALELAATGVAARTGAGRVLLREQDVSTLTEDASYDLAFVPAPFVPPTALSTGLPNVARALKPGGWLCLGHGNFGGNPLEHALTRFKTTVYGGTALDDENAYLLCSAAGLVEVRTTPTPPGAPAITVGRRPPTASTSATT